MTRSSSKSKDKSEGLLAKVEKNLLFDAKVEKSAHSDPKQKVATVSLGVRKKISKKTFEKNADNRPKRPLEGAHGSKTLVQHYHDAVNLVTGEVSGAIDTFEEFYYKGEQWKNDWAATKHTAMVALRASQPEQEADGDSQGSGGSASTVESRVQPKDTDTTTQVMGSRSRYVKGLGRLPKLSVVRGPRATSRSRKQDDKIASLQQTIHDQQKRFDALLERLELVFPGFSSGQPPPTCSSIRPPSPPAPTM